MPASLQPAIGSPQAGCGPAQASCGRAQGLALVDDRTLPGMQIAPARSLDHVEKVVGKARHHHQQAAEIAHNCDRREFAADHDGRFEVFPGGARDVPKTADGGSRR